MSGERLAEVVDIATRRPALPSPSFSKLGKCKVADIAPFLEERSLWETPIYVATRLSPVDLLALKDGPQCLRIGPGIPADASPIATSACADGVWVIYEAPRAVRPHFGPRFRDVEDVSRTVLEFSRRTRGRGYRCTTPGTIDQGVRYLRALIDPSDGLREDAAAELALELADMAPEMVDVLRGSRPPASIYVGIFASFDRFPIHVRQYKIRYPF